jgi:crotonobetainyl-CoA:carnitine CoA-transferase CaiB-like acyl-CoA transferase
VLANQALFYLSSGQVPQRLGNAHATVVPYQVFPVKDGHIIIACGNDTQFARLAVLLGDPALADEVDFKTNAGRVMHRDRLIPRMLKLTEQFTRDELLGKLEAAGVPGGPINTLADVFADPQVLHRHMRVDLPDAAAKGGTIPGVRSPIMIDGVPQHAQRPSPGLGQHTEEILREIGES